MLALLLAQAAPWQRDKILKPFDQFDRKPERLGPGPHTLVVSDGSAMTRVQYKSGPACQRARDAVRRQVAPPVNTPGVIYGPSRTTAFCVPR